MRKQDQKQDEYDKLFYLKNKNLLQTELTGGSVLAFRLIQLVMNDSLKKMKKTNNSQNEGKALEKRQELISQILLSQKNSNNKKIQILQMLGFLKSMDFYSQRAHEASCNISEQLTKKKAFIRPYHNISGNVPNLPKKSKIIVSPFREFKPELNNLKQKIGELRKGQDRTFRSEVEEFKGFFKRFNTLQEALIFRNEHLFKRRSKEWKEVQEEGEKIISKSSQKTKIREPKRRESEQNESEYDMSSESEREESPKTQSPVVSLPIVEAQRPEEENQSEPQEPRDNDAALDEISGKLSSSLNTSAAVEQLPTPPQSEIAVNISPVLSQQPQRVEEEAKLRPTSLVPNEEPVKELSIPLPPPIDQSATNISPDRSPPLTDQSTNKSASKMTVPPQQLKSKGKNIPQSQSVEGEISADVSKIPDLPLLIDQSEEVSSNGSPSLVKNSDSPKIPTPPLFTQGQKLEASVLPQSPSLEHQTESTKVPTPPRLEHPEDYPQQIPSLQPEEENEVTKSIPLPLSLKQSNEASEVQIPLPKKPIIKDPMVVHAAKPRDQLTVASIKAESPLLLEQKSEAPEVQTSLPQERLKEEDSIVVQKEQFIETPIENQNPPSEGQSTEIQIEDQNPLSQETEVKIDDKNQLQQEQPTEIQIEDKNQLPQEIKTPIAVQSSLQQEQSTKEPKDIQSSLPLEQIPEVSEVQTPVPLDISTDTKIEVQTPVSVEQISEVPKVQTLEALLSLKKSNEAAGAQVKPIFKEPKKAADMSTPSLLGQQPKAPLVHSPTPQKEPSKSLLNPIPKNESTKLPLNPSSQKESPKPLQKTIPKKKSANSPWDKTSKLKSEKPLQKPTQTTQKESMKSLWKSTPKKEPTKSLSKPSPLKEPLKAIWCRTPQRESTKPLWKSTDKKESPKTHEKKTPLKESRKLQGKLNSSPLKQSDKLLFKVTSTPHDESTKLVLALPPQKKSTQPPQIPTSIPLEESTDPTQIFTSVPKPSSTPSLQEESVEAKQSPAQPLPEESIQHLEIPIPTPSLQEELSESQQSSSLFRQEEVPNVSNILLSRQQEQPTTLIKHEPTIPSSSSTTSLSEMNNNYIPNINDPEQRTEPTEARASSLAPELKSEINSEGKFEKSTEPKNEKFDKERQTETVIIPSETQSRSRGMTLPSVSNDKPSYYKVASLKKLFSNSNLSNTN